MQSKPSRGVVALFIPLLLSPTAHSKKPKRPAPPPSLIDVRIAEAGQLTELHVRNLHAQIRSTAGPTSRERKVSEEEWARLVMTARDAQRGENVRRSCGDNETFVSVTIDETTVATAICPESPANYAAPWRALVEVVRALARSVVER